MKNWTFIVFTLLSSATHLSAQAAVASSAGVEPPAPLEVALDYSALRTNAPPGGCGCFWMQGAKADFGAPVFRGLSIAGELSGDHATNINAAHEDLSLIMYLLGARFTPRLHGKIQPFAQALIGGVRGFDAIFPGPQNSTTAPDSLATALGGGINVIFSRRIALRAVEADFVETHLPNDGNDRQDNIHVSVGIVFRFGVRPALGLDAQQHRFTK